MIGDPTISTYDSVAARFAEMNWEVGRDLAESRVSFARAVAGDQPPALFRILDAGCGPGRDSAWFREHGFRVVGVDLSTGMLVEARRRAPDVEFVQADLRELPFPADSFDGVWCSASLLHVRRPDVPGVLASFSRLMGHGWLWLSVKEGAGEALVGGAYGTELTRRFTYFRRHELELYLERAGFAVRSVGEAPPSAGQPQTWLRVLAQTKLQTPLVSASALIFDDAGRVLLSERADGRGWNVPTGYLSPNEAPNEGAVREALEETGLSIVVERLLGIYTRPTAGGGLVIHTFLCRVTGGQFVPTKESRRHDWFSPEALPTPMFSWRHVEFVRDAVAIRAGQMVAPILRKHHG